MTGPDRDDDLVDRVLALEQQQRADRRALGSLDADVSDLQAQRRQDVRLLQSLRDTQIEHGERLGRLESGLGRVESRLDSLESSTSSEFAAVNARVGRVESRLGSLESSTAAGFAAVNARVGRVESGLDSLRSSTSSGFAAVGAQLDVIVELLGGGHRD